MADTHSVMTKKLAQALIESGVQHFDMGGDISQGFDTFTSRLGRPGQSGYQAGQPNIDQQNFGPQIAQTQGQQAQVYQEQQNLASQLLANSNGYGPNPAQTQLAQTTGQNTANQAALMNSSRGASANPALMARQAAMVGANNQQTAVGQAATLGAQQQIAARQALQQQQAQMSNQALQGQSIAQGAQAAQNTALTQGSLGTQNINASTANTNAQQSSGLIGGIIGGISSMFAKGGEVKRMADGGIAQFSAPQVDEDGPGGLPYKSLVPQKSGGGGSGLIKSLMLMNKGGPVKMAGGGVAPMGLAQFSAPPVMDISPYGLGYRHSASQKKTSKDDKLYPVPPDTPLSPTSTTGTPLGGDVAPPTSDTVTLPPDQGGLDKPMYPTNPMPNPSDAYKSLYDSGVNQNAPYQEFSYAAQGGDVPGKATVKGNSPKNDTVPALLSAGEIVLPRSVTQGGNVEKKAIEFLKHLKGKGSNYNDVIEARHTKRMCSGGRL